MAITSLARCATEAAASLPSKLTLRRSDTGDSLALGRCGHGPTTRARSHAAGRRASPGFRPATRRAAPALRPGSGGACSGPPPAPSALFETVDLLANRRIVAVLL